MYIVKNDVGKPIFVVEDYDKDIPEIIDWLYALIQSTYWNLPEGKSIIVLDVDGTALFTRSDGQVIRNEPIFSFFHDLLMLNILTAFVTGRTEDYRNVTMSQLGNFQYQGWIDLFMRPSQEVPLGPFKTLSRRRLTQRGYRILVNIGDNWSDLEGGDFMIGIKLPHISCN